MGCFKIENCSESIKLSIRKKFRRARALARAIFDKKLSTFLKNGNIFMFSVYRITSKKLLNIVDVNTFKKRRNLVYLLTLRFDNTLRVRNLYARTNARAIARVF